MLQVDRTEYQEVDNDCCPCCGWGMMDAAFECETGMAQLIEVDKMAAPPDVSSTFYECYSAIWLITCSNCGTKFAAEYDNY